MVWWNLHQIILESFPDISWIVSEDFHPRYAAGMLSWIKITFQYWPSIVDGILMELFWWYGAIWTKYFLKALQICLRYCQKISGKVCRWYAGLDKNNLQIPGKYYLKISQILEQRVLRKYEGWGHDIGWDSIKGLSWWYCDACGLKIGKFASEMGVHIKIPKKMFFWKPWR